MYLKIYYRTQLHQNLFFFILQVFEIHSRSEAFIALFIYFSDELFYGVSGSVSRRLGIYYVQGDRFPARMESRLLLQYHDILPSLAGEERFHRSDNRNI